MKRLFAAIIASVVLGSGTALACPPPPPPPMEGESPEAHQARMTAVRDAEAAARRAGALTRQQQLWDESESVLLARITEVSRIGGPFFYAPETRVRLAPVRTLKGRARRLSFSLRTNGMTSCGPIGFDVNFGAVGEEFVIFVRSGRPSQNTVLDGVALSWIQDPRVLELLAQR